MPPPLPIPLLRPATRFFDPDLLHAIRRCFGHPSAGWGATGHRSQKSPSLRAFTGLLRPLSDEAPTRARTEFRPLSNAPSTAVGGVLVGAQ